MTRLLRWLPVLGLLGCTLGCALCAGPYDSTYNAFGGAWQRDDMCCSRVGSAFAPAGTGEVWADGVPVYDQGVIVAGDEDLAPVPPQ